MGFDFKISRSMTKWAYNHKTVSYVLRLFSVLSYNVFVHLLVIVAIFIMLIYGQWAEIDVVLLPFLFGITCILYMHNNIFRMRPGCRYHDLRRVMDPVYCEEWNARNSMPCKQVFLLTTISTCILLYILDKDELKKQNKLFFLDWTNPYLMFGTIVILSLSILICCLDRLIHGYNYISDILMALFLGYMLGYISYRMCFPRRLTHHESIQWIVIRLFAICVCFGVFTRFLLTNLPYTISKTRIKIHTHTKRKKTNRYESVAMIVN